MKWFLLVGGPNLAAQALKAELLDERRFRNGVVHLRYRVL